jgi:hypothetical protein
LSRHRKDLGARKHIRVELHNPGSLIPAPDAPWIECQILDVSDAGACLEVGALAMPKIFGLAFTAGDEVFGCVRWSGAGAGLSVPASLPPTSFGRVSCRQAKLSRSFREPPR